MSPIILTVLLTTCLVPTSLADPQQLGKHFTARLWVTVENETYYNFLTDGRADELGRADDRVARILHLANQLSRQVNLHIQYKGSDRLVDKVRADEASRYHFYYFQFKMQSKFERLDVSDDRLSDFFQIWTARVFPDTEPHMTKYRTFCQTNQMAILSLRKKDASVKSDEEIAQTVVHSLLTSIGVVGQQACQCDRGINCILNRFPSVWSFPLCARQITEKRLDFPNSCAAIPPNQKYSHLPICGNGVREREEECDCFNFNTTCRACCQECKRIDDCSNTESPVVLNMSTPLHTRTTRPAAGVNKMPIIIVSSIALLVLLIVIVGLIVLMTRRSKRKKKRNKTPVSSSTRSSMSGSKVGPTTQFFG